MFTSPLREIVLAPAAAEIVREAFACFFPAVKLVGFRVTFAFVLVSSRTLEVGGPLCITVATRRALLYT